MSNDFRSDFPETTRVIIGTTLVAATLIVFPFAAFYIHNFYLLRKTSVLKKRYVDLVIRSSICLLLYVILINPLWALQTAFAHYFTKPQRKIIQTVFILIGILLSHFCMWLILARFWLAYFDFSWTKATLNAEWKVHIDPNNGSSKNEQWFLLNKAKYGNLEIIRKRATIIGLCIGIINVILFEAGIWIDQWDVEKTTVVDGLCFLLVIVLILIIWKKMPPVYDTLFYREEMKKLGFNLVFMICCYFLLLIASQLSKDDMVKYSIGSVLLLYMCFSLIFIQTFWVYNKIKKSVLLRFRLQDGGKSFNSTIRSASTTNNHDHIFDIQHNKQRDDNKDLRRYRGRHILPNVLTNKHSFDLFMQHLATEFCMEILLAFVEFTQFRMLLESDEQFMSTAQNDNHLAIKCDNLTDDEDGASPGPPGPSRKNSNASPQPTSPTTPVSPATPATPITPTTPISPMQRMASATQSAQSAQSWSYKAQMAKLNTKKRNKRNKKNTKKRKYVAYDEIKLPSKIPQSVIVYGDRADSVGYDKYLEIANDLFAKYVRNGSEFEINVSYSMRYGVRHWLQKSKNNDNDNDNKGLYTLFESCRKELYILMIQSCQAFVDTDKFKTIQNEIIVSDQ